MKVLLFRIADRPYGFRVVAIVAEDLETARARLALKFGAQWESPHRHNFAQLHDECETTDGNLATLTFEE